MLKGKLRSKERAGLTETSGMRAEPLMPTPFADLCPSKAGPLAFSEGPAMTSRLLALPPSRLPSSPSALYLLLRRTWPSGASPRREARPWALGKVQVLCWLCGRVMLALPFRGWGRPTVPQNPTQPPLGLVQGVKGRVWEGGQEIWVLTSAPPPTCCVLGAHHSSP